MRNKHFTTTPFTNTSVIACLLTTDERLLVEERGGEVMPGMYNLMPAGSITFRERYLEDPIVDTFYREARSEVGSNFGYSTPQIIGVIKCHNQIPGLKFVTYGWVQGTLKEVRDLHREGIHLYNRVKAEHGEQAAKQALQEHPELPSEAWEHQNIYGIFNTDEDIASCIIGEKTLEITRDALHIYRKTAFHKV